MICKNEWLKTENFQLLLDVIYLLLKIFIYIYITCTIHMHKYYGHLVTR